MCEIHELLPTVTLSLIVSAYIFLHIRMHIAQPTPLQNCCLPALYFFPLTESSLPVRGIYSSHWRSCISILPISGIYSSYWRNCIFIWSMHTAQCKEADEGRAPLKPIYGQYTGEKTEILKFLSTSQITNSAQQGLVETLQFNPKYCTKAVQP